MLRARLILTLMFVSLLIFTLLQMGEGWMKRLPAQTIEQTVEQSQIFRN